MAHAAQYMFAHAPMPPAEGTAPEGPVATLASDDCRYAVAVAGAIFDHFNIPYTVCTGYFCINGPYVHGPMAGQRVMPDDEVIAHSWLLSPGYDASGNFDTSHRVCTDLSVLAWGAKGPRVLGQEFTSPMSLPALQHVYMPTLPAGVHVCGMELDDLTEHIIDRHEWVATHAPLASKAFLDSLRSDIDESYPRST